MGSSFTTSIIIAALLLVVALLGFAGKCIPFKGKKDYSPEQLSKFARFSAPGYLIMAAGCGVEAYLKYANMASEKIQNITLVVAFVIGVIIVIAGKKKYL